jgi:hypothetical protein
MSIRTGYAAAALFLIVVSQPACDPAEDVGGQQNADSHSDALRAATTIESAAVITYVSSYFAAAANVAMRDIDTTQASSQVVAQVQTRVKADLADVACVTVETDDATYVDLHFAGCVGAQGALGLTGTVSAQVGFETKPCGPTTCPVAVVYSVNTLDLQLGDASIVGNWTVRDPLALDLPYTWAGILQVVTPERGVFYSSTASFTHANDCVDLTVDSTLGGSGQRSLAVSAADVHRCMGQCPSSGSVSLTNQDGETLSWSYDGTSSADVTSSESTDFALGLTCG